MSKQTDLINIPDAITVSGSNVGIGTTPSTDWRTSFNTTATQVGLTGSLFNLDVSTGDRRCMVSSNAILNASGDFQHILEGHATIYSQQSGTHRWYTAPSASAGATAAASERLRIDASGNVGINTNSVVTSTGTNLQVTCTTGNARLVLDNTTTNGQEYRIYSGGAGELSFYNTDSNTERARIISQGAFQASTNGSFRTWAGNITGHQMNTNQQSQVCFTADAENSGYTRDVIRSLCNRGASSSWKFLTCTSGDLGDDEFYLRGDGQAYADGSWNGGGADYAEYFETTTGNAIPRGTTVVLDNNKVRAATSDDLASSIIGVIRPKEDGQISAMVGNTGWSKWSEKYLTDDFGVYLMDDHNVIEFDGKTYESHKVPEDVTIPDDAVTTTHDGNGLKFQHRRENPDYDSSLTYSPREDRDEWVIVGLLGQVRILGGQPTGDRWIKMRDISETVEEWFIR